MRKLYVMRHMQTSFNREDRFQGVSDSPITEDGYKKIELFRNFFEKKHVDKIYISPLKRCIDTALLLFTDCKDKTSIDDRLSEICYGEWEEKSKKDIVHDAIWQKRKQDRINFKHPGQYKGHFGESYSDLYKRLVEFWEEMAANKNETIIIVAHMGVMIAAKKYFLQLSDTEINNFSPKNNMVQHICIEEKATYEELFI